MKERTLFVLLTILCLVSCSTSDESLAEPVARVEQALLSGPMPYRGVNLASAEFAVDADGVGQLPGTHGTDYVYPDPAYVSGYNSADYFIGKGMTTFRLAFRWERLQPNRRQAFNSAELTRLRTTVNRLTGKGAQVLLDPHNYARYGTALIGSSSVPNADFADFWSRLATEFKGNLNVLFGLVNEPHDMSTEQWVGAANAALASIRSAGATNLVLIPGNGWTGAHSWSQSWYGTSNATAMLSISDPGNNYAFEVHQYLDADSSGSGSSCVSNTIGSERMQPFTSWLRANGKKGFLGEFGGGSGQTCLNAMDNILDHLEANSDVYLGWTYWAAGPWWGDYFSSLEPNGGVDKPQMDTLEPHLGSITPPPPPPPPPPASSCTDGIKNGTETGIDCGGSCTACSTACQTATYEAETMFHSTGGSTTGGWNIWSNGYISTNHNFTAGGASIKVRAKGSIAAGVWPRMVVSVAGTTIGTVNVSTTTFTEYSFLYTATVGLKEVRVTFDNDLNVNGEDRNLLVDNVVVPCPITCQPLTYEAESMFHSTGGSTTGGWNIWSNGYISTNHNFTGTGSRTLTVTAKGSVAAGVWPHMVVSVGGVSIGAVNVTSTAWAPYSFTFSTSAGTKELRVTFDNDLNANGQDRNLLVDRALVGCPGG